MRASSCLRWAIVLLLAPLAARVSAAPSPTFWYFDVGGGLAAFHDDIRYPTMDLKDAAHAGVRLGWQLTPNFAIEGAGGWSPAQEDTSNGADVTFIHAAGDLVFTTPQSKVGALFLGAGFGYGQRDSDAAPDDLHFGVFDMLAGWRWWATDNFGIRLEARNLLNLPEKNWDRAKHNDIIFMGALGFAMGGKPKDADGDGVADKKDKCPGTPSGAVVNAEGCPTDRDGDGVFDGLDRCPETPKGATVNSEGCPGDADKDGIFDGLDQCADTPAGATVNAQGCPSDSDGDGVFDGLDQCANTAAGAKVDEKGCPTDSDGDGVVDGLDKCPNTAANLKVDKDGCPIEVTEKETELLETGLIRLQNVNFETAKSDILPESKPVLDVVGQVLGRWPELRIEVGGHTDSRGSNAYNQKLSEERAQSVLNYITSQFPNLKAEQFSAKGYGESKPLVSNTSPANMAKNRRVEFVVLNKDVLKREIERRKMLEK